MSCFKYDRNIVIGKVGFNAVTRHKLIDLIENVPLDKSSAYVTFTGMQIIVKSEKCKEVEQAQNNATICAGDGMPVKWIAQHNGIECERCSGPDVMEQILNMGIEKKRRHYFYGSTNETLKLLKEKLEIKYPGIIIAGMYSPPFRELSDEEDIKIVKMINDAKPDYLWVGLGAPKQDLWMEAHQTKIRNCRMMGVGAAFNFFAGTVKRAPVVIQNSGFEWLYRLIQEPRHLWKRYIIGGVKFIGIFLKSMIKHNKDKNYKTFEGRKI